MEPNRGMQNHEGIEWRGQRRKSGKSGQNGEGKGKWEVGEGKLGYK